MELQPVTRWYGTFSWDTRDLIFNPTQGFYLKNTFTYVGGVLPSTRDFIKNAFKGEVYFTLFDIPAFKDWDFKLVLGLKSSFSMVLPQYYPSDYRDWDGPWVSGIRAETTDLLYIDGMMIARGWNRLYDLKVLWDNWIEFKIPLVEQYIWWDFFLSGTAPYEDISELQSLKIDDFLFSFGGGARLAIPQLPIGMYLVKRFKILDGSVAWESRSGSLFPPLNLDFVISFTLDIF